MTHKQERSIAADKTPVMGSRAAANNDSTAGEKSAVKDNTPKVKHIIKYFLVAVKDKTKTEITKYPFTIGRLSKDDLRIYNNNVSRRHAIIDCKEGTLVISNNTSKNGLRVNNHVVERVVLLDGDEIAIASEKFTLEVEKRVVKQPVIKQAKIIKPIASLPVTPMAPQHIPVTNKMQAIEETPETEESPVVAKKETGFKAKMALFSLLGVVLITSTILGYQYYKKTTLEARVHVISQGSGEIKTTAEKVVVKPVVADTKPEEVIVKIVKPDVQTENEIKVVKAQKPVQKKTPVRKKYKPIVVVNKKSLRDKVLFERDNAKKKILKAQVLYYSGHYDESINTLTTIETSKRYPAQFRVSARDYKNKINELNAYYKNGYTAYHNDDKDEAFIFWVKLLSKHKTYFPDKESFYADEISLLVAKEFEERGNQAYTEQNWKEAYANWKNSVAISPKSSVEQSIKLMDDEIRHLYRTGYRYETVNISRAVEYWKELKEKAPEDHEYYLKASAKINWYESKRK